MVTTKQQMRGCVSIQKVTQEGRARDMWAPGQANNLAPFHKLLLTLPA